MEIMRKMKLLEVLNLNKAINSVLINAEGLERVIGPFQMKYTLIKQLNNFKSDIELIEKERIELIKKFGIQDGDNESNIRVPKEKEDDFFVEFNNVLDIESSSNLIYIKSSLFEEFLESNKDETIDIQGVFVIEKMMVK